MQNSIPKSSLIIMWRDFSSYNRVYFSTTNFIFSKTPIVSNRKKSSKLIYNYSKTYFQAAVYEVIIYKSVKIKYQTSVKDFGFKATDLDAFSLPG